MKRTMFLATFLIACTPSQSSNHPAPNYRHLPQHIIRAEVRAAFCADHNEIPECKRGTR